MTFGGSGGIGRRKLIGGTYIPIEVKMTTRSGAMYQSETEGGRVKGAADEDAARTGATDAEAASLTDLVRMLMEDRRRRDEELADEQRRRELEASRHEEVM